MISVVAMCATSPETCATSPDVVSDSTDVATVRKALVADLWSTATADYAARVLEWFETSRDVPGMIANPDGSVDVWVFDAMESRLAA